MIKKASKTVSGWKVGQVKELCYRGLGDGHLARPSKVTAEIEAGKAGVIDIDRESRPGSPIQDRHIRILSDYLKASVFRHLTVDRKSIFTFTSAGSVPRNTTILNPIYMLDSIQFGEIGDI